MRLSCFCSHSGIAYQALLFLLFCCCKFAAALANTSGVSLGHVHLIYYILMLQALAILKLWLLVLVIMSWFVTDTKMEGLLIVLSESVDWNEIFQDHWGSREQVSSIWYFTIFIIYLYLRCFDYVIFWNLSLLRCFEYVIFWNLGEIFESFCWHCITKQ